MAYLNSEEGEDAIITVVEHTDSICAPCPSKRDALCVSQKKIIKLDTISWKEAKKRIQQEMTLEKFHMACAPCAWKKEGMCESVLRSL